MLIAVQGDRKEKDSAFGPILHVPILPVGPSVDARSPYF